MRPRLFHLTILAPLLSTACPDDGASAQTDGAGTTGTSADSTTAPTTGPAFDGVVAPALATFRPRDGAPVEQLLDPLTRYQSLSIVADGQTYPGVLADASRIEFAGVPEVTYRMRALYTISPLLPDLPPFVFDTETDARELATFAGIFAGRPDVARSPSRDTRLKISATGMQALGEDDRFELYSYGADALDSVRPSFDPLDGTNSPIAGDTALTGWITGWSPATGWTDWPLVDPSKGDDFTLAHLAARKLVDAPTGEQLLDMWSYADVEVLREVAALTSQPMIGGATTAAQGAFAPVGGQSVMLDVRLTEFEAAGAPSGVDYSTGCWISAYLEPGVEAPIIGMIPTLGAVSVESRYVPVDPLCPPDNCDPMLCAACDEIYLYPGDRVVPFEYANPYPGGTVRLSVSCGRYTYVTDPNSFDYDSFYSGITVDGKLADLVQGPIVPRMGPVGDIRINGAPFAPDDLVSGVGLTPTISFAPPTLGKSDYYRVWIASTDDVYDVDDRLRRFHGVYAIHTTATSVTIPAGVLEPGGTYVVQVVNQRGRELTAGTWYSHDTDTATAVGGRFTP